MVAINRLLRLVLNLIRSKSRLIIYLAIVIIFELVVSSLFSTSNTSKDTNKLSKNKFKFKSNNLIYLDDDSSVNTSNYLLELKRIESKSSRIRDLYNNHLAKEFKQIDPYQRNLNQINKTSYLILEYTKVFFETRYCESDESIYLNQCPYKNCKFTCDKSKISKSDAMLFHEWDLELISIEERIYLKKTLTYSSFRKDQIWIIWNDEPLKVSNKLDYYYFNWTMAYRPDAEIHDCSYGCIYKKSTSEDDRLLFIENMRVEFRKRANRALWFVSNCKSSLRLDLAFKLNKFYPVRVNGKCDLNIDHNKDTYFGELLKSLNDYFGFNQKKEEILDENGEPKSVECKRNSRCEYDEFRTNKFYLSFESKNCTNYITEKLWRILRTKLIPIVFQPNKEYYEINAPPDSFIHASDFDYDPVKLAKYLTRVSNDFDLYVKYHMWRLDYDVVYSIQQSESRRLCQLCTKLNMETSNIYYKKVSNWFNDFCVVN